eukprot:TRINITY_DN674_c0_g1_i1.p2 TRINITY_DN674_c0_g1~~TRINITY_DN674_c0_g1_i1.p2  ORF type:complete len:203 (+),score=43.81 TRINITY_DN674_c0_g1_i1:922-1530(+)
MMEVSMPKYKTEAWLEKYGWSRGQGLGKDLSGRQDFVKVSKKDDKLGLGKPAYKLVDFSHWDDLYKKAAEEIKVESGDQGVILKKNNEADKPRQTFYGGMFVKSSTKTMEKTEAVKEENLYELCGKRELRIYKQDGKLNRLKQAETENNFSLQEYFKDEITEKDVDETTNENVDDEEKKSKKKKRKSSKSKSERRSKKQRTQ